MSSDEKKVISMLWDACENYQECPMTKEEISLELHDWEINYTRRIVRLRKPKTVHSYRFEFRL